MRTYRAYFVAQNSSTHLLVAGGSNPGLTFYINYMKVEEVDIQYVPEVTSWANYYAFGWIMPGRDYNNTNDDYRFGFQGQERDDEVKGVGNSYNTFFRQYDPRLGKWLSVDPKANSFAWSSSYAGLNNNPISYFDILGDSSALFDVSTGGFLGYEDDGRDEMTGLFVAFDESGERQDLLQFQFNDFKNDRKGIENGVFKATFEPSDKVDKTVSKSGVNSFVARANAMSFAYKEGQSGGKIDFSEGPYAPARVGIHVVLDNNGAVGYNDYDYGNYLTGAAFRSLGIPLWIAKLGAHHNALMNEYELDTDIDQKAIENGYNRKN